MFGAIIGDMVGAKYEFNNIKTKDFPIASLDDFHYTDDSIMTLAVGEMLQNSVTDNKDDIIDIFKKWGRSFPDAGYGGHFFHWVLGEDRRPYNSCGNGSAMRVSACGWYGRDEEDVEKLATAVSEVTHNHPEGIKGAVVTAMCVYYARKGKDKDFIKKYVEQFYNLDFDYEELRKTYEHEAEICQITVPQAIYCFLISKDFEDCLRTTISIGGDCDTTAAISCAIAEAYYKYIPLNIAILAYKALPKLKGGCDAKTLVKDFIEYRNSILVTDSEINDDTQFFAIKYKSKEGTSLEWIFSNKMYPLINYINSEVMADVEEGRQQLFSQMAQIINLNLLNESKINTYVKIANSLLEKYNTGISIAYYKSKDEAYKYLVDELNIKEKYSDTLFNEYYTIK